MKKIYDIIKILAKYKNSDSKYNIKMTNFDIDILNIDIFTILLKLIKISVILKFIRVCVYIFLSFYIRKKRGISNSNIN